MAVQFSGVTRGYAQQITIHMLTTHQGIQHARLMVPDDGGWGTPGQFSGPVLNVALGCVDLRVRSSDVRRR